MMLRRNVIYLYSKKVHLNRLFHSQSSGYDVVWGLQITFLLFSAPKIPQMTPASRAEKSIKMSFFTIIFEVSSALTKMPQKRSLNAAQKNTFYITDMKYQL